MKKRVGTHLMAETICCYIFFSFVVAAAAFAMVWEGIHPGTGTCFGETSVVELLQVGFLLLTIGCASLAGHQEVSWAPLSRLYVGLAGVALIREFDFALDRYIFDGAWQTLALGVVLMTGRVVIVHRRRLMEEIGEVVDRASFGLMVSGFFTVFIFSRLVGQKILWETLMGDGYMRVVKNAVEEGTELLGYALIFIGMMVYLRETLVHQRRVERRSPQQTPLPFHFFFQDRSQH